MGKGILKQALAKFFLGVVLLGVLIFLPAGSFRYWQGWLLMAILFIPMFVAGLVMMARNPYLLLKRLNATEQEAEQKTVVKLSGLLFIAAFVVAGLNWRLGWWVLPDWAVWVAAGLFLASYLLYAEALFEATGNPAFRGALSGTSFSLSPLEAINRVRAVYGLPGLDSGIGSTDFRQRLRNERRVELAFEGHRFWDLRRWKIGTATKDVYGLDIRQEEDGRFTSTRTLVQSRDWDDKMYFYPISEVERHKNSHLEQNPGW